MVRPWTTASKRPILLVVYFAWKNCRIFFITYGSVNCNEKGSQDKLIAGGRKHFSHA